MAIVAAGANLYARLNLQDGSAGFPVWRSGDGGRSWTKPSAPLPFLVHSFVQLGKGNAGAPGGYVYALERRSTGIDLLRVPAASTQSSSAYEYSAERRRHRLGAPADRWPKRSLPTCRSSAPKHHLCARPRPLPAGSGPFAG